MHVQYDSCVANTGCTEFSDTRSRHTSRREHVFSFASACLRLTVNSMKAWGKTLDPTGSSGVSNPLPRSNMFSERAETYEL
jgi:hypothetical protein